MEMDVKQVLSNLSSAYSQLLEKITKADEQIKATELRDVEIDKIKVGQKEKDIELNKREAAVRHIESIVKESEKAQTLTKEAKIGNDALDEREKDFAAKAQKFMVEKAQALREIEGGKKSNQGQADALVKERNAFESRVRAFKAVQAAV